MTLEEIARNVAHVREEIRRAALEAGRQPEEILLAAATKTNDAERIRAAIEAGVDICGENRVQEMLEKRANDEAHFSEDPFNVAVSTFDHFA